MHRDGTDEATVRHLLKQAAAALPVLGAKDDPIADHDYPTVRLLHETARLSRRRCEREVGAQLPGMTHARCTVLVHIAQHERVNQATLARILGIRAITLVRLLDRLETAGFVLRMPDPDDRRAHILALTSKAQPIVKHLTTKTVDDRRLGISKAEASQLRVLLCRVRANLMGENLSPKPLRTRGHA
jgi:DNA-binding MarR family transcriptional regulator